MNTLLFHKQTEAPPPDKPRKPWTLVASLVILCVVIAAGLFVWLAPDAPEQNSGPVPVIAPVPVENDLTAGPCGFAQPWTSDVIVPPDTAWKLNGSMAVPVSPSVGPLTTDTGLSTCFARTPGGALFAVSHFVAELANPIIPMSRTIEQKMSHSTGYDSLLLRAQEWEATPRDNATTIVRQIAGYRFQSFDPNVAVIDLVQRNTSGTGAGMMAAISYVLRWENGDWKIVPAIDGGDLPSREVTDLSSPYTPFNGA
jgi:hypothetical protein